MKQVLKIQNLRVHRGPDFCLQIDNLALGQGRLLCITGPNGSGKTTLIECLSGLLQPTNGSVAINGRLVNKNLYLTKSTVGLIPDDEDWLIKELCAKEYFSLLAKVYRDASVKTDIENRISYLAASLGFTAFSQPLQSLSHGNKKKVQIIAGLMHQPKMLIVDELRNGLDPLAIIAAETLIKKEIEQSTCIIAATHDLWWAERMADEVLLLIHGSVAVHKNVGAIIKQHGSLEHLFITLAGKNG